MNGRFKTDIQYIYLNFLVNRIPSWTIRRCLYRRSGMRIGKGARIGIGTVVYCPNPKIIGNSSVINEFCYSDGRVSLDIDAHLTTSIYSKIITATHMMNSKSFEYKTGRVKIQHHVWLGTGATVLNDTVLAPYTVIGAGSVYKGVSESYDVIVGNPGKVIKKRSKNQIYHNDYSPYFR